MNRPGVFTVAMVLAMHCQQAQLWAAVPDGGEVVRIPAEVLSEETAPAANSKRLDITIHGVEGALLRNVRGLLDIWQFDQRSVPTTARLQFLHLAAVEQIKKALQPFGYYRARVNQSLIEDDDAWLASYLVEPGDRIRIADVDIELLDYEGVDNALDPFIRAQIESGLVPGVALNQQAYDDLKTSWQTSATELGFFEAEFIAKKIAVDLNKYTADIQLHFRPGPRHKFASVRFSQDRDWIRMSLLRGFSEIEPDQPYDAELLQRMQSDLFATGYYEKVIVHASLEDAVDRRIPVLVELIHKKPRRYTFGLGLDTDTGVRVRAGTTGRRVNRRGHRIETRGQVSEIGYGIAGNYVIPTGDPRSDRYGLRSSYSLEESDTREFQSLSIGGSYQRREGLWFETRGLDYQVEEFGLDGETPLSTLLIPSISWIRTEPLALDRRINVVDGSWLQFELKGASANLLSDTSFVQVSAAFKAITTLGWGHRLLMRGALGASKVDDFSELPATLRFYTGGDRSVRGYGYEVIAPLDSEREVAGGKHLVELSVEYEVPVFGNFSFAGFFDAGDAFDKTAEIRTGVGMGFRWQSPIGPVRFDVGRALDAPGAGNVRLHLSIGPDL